MLTPSSNLQLAFWTVATLLLLVGCTSTNQNGHTFLVEIDPVSETPIVLLEEVIEVKDFVDSATPERQTLQHVHFRVIETPRFKIEIVPSKVSSLPAFWYNQYHETRFTIYSPGRALLTVYPLGWDGKNPVTQRLQYRSTMGWRKNKYLPMSSQNSLPISPWFDIAGKSVDLRLEMRQLRVNGRIILPSPFLDDVAPSAICDVDTLTFSDQMHALSSSLNMVNTIMLSDEEKQIMWRAIHQEYDSLEQAGFRDSLPLMQGELMREIAARLNAKVQ